MQYELAENSWGPEEYDAITKVIASDQFTMKGEVAAFEEEFAAYHNKKYGIMVNSGSSANLIAVASLCFKKDHPLQRGDEIIVPAISWSTTYHPLQQYGLKLRFVDVNLETLNIDIQKLEDAITPNTRMIVAVSILVNPANLDKMRALADKHSLYFLEDNCESLDANLNEKKAGSFGDIGTSSFFFSHHISTIEGGMLVTDDEELYHLARSLRAHGWTRDLPENSPIFEKGENDLFEAYRFILPGYNVRPQEINAAIGRQQLKKLPALTAERRKNLKLFQSLFANDERFIIQNENGESSAFSFTIILNQKFDLDRKKIFAALEKENIRFRIITGGCFLRHDVIKYYDYEIFETLDNAMTAHDFGFFVGNHPFDLTEQLTKLYETLDQAAKS